MPTQAFSRGGGGISFTIDEMARMTRKAVKAARRSPPSVTTQASTPGIGARTVRTIMEFGPQSGDIIGVGRTPSGQLRIVGNPRFTSLTRFFVKPFLVP